MSIIINPGSGPVLNATEENARSNLAALAGDLIAGGQKAYVASGPVVDKGDGRWLGRIFVDGSLFEVEMPGLPLERVRFMGEDDQNIWDFPRMYVNGSSWVWKFALDVFESDDEDED